MTFQSDLSTLISNDIAKKLVAHKEKEREHVEGLLASQKHLTSNVRTLINSLDQVLALSAPKFNSSQPDVLRSAVSRAKLLQKQLETIKARLQRIQVHLQGHEQQATQPLLQQQGDLPEQQQQQQQRQQEVQQQQQQQQQEQQQQQPPQQQQVQQQHQVHDVSEVFAEPQLRPP